MLLLTLGLIVFFAIHLLPTVPDMRKSVVDRMGAQPYQILFAVVSLVGLTLIVLGYQKLAIGPTGKNPQIWSPPTWSRHLALTLMLPAMILLVAAYVPSRIRTAVKHPMLLAIKLWALAHLLANGDLASLALFGSFLAYAVYDWISVKKRAAMGPLGARTGGLAGDLTAVIGGLALYAFLLVYAHNWLFGAWPLPSLAR